MAASYGSGLHSPPPIGRPIDRVFEDAQFTGEIYLNGRKLRDYPKHCSKYDLSDTNLVDISRNRLTELPQEVCEYLHVERINCYHNVIRSIPDAISQLQTLTHLNLSRNQLTVLPSALCLLNALEILSVSNNKLVSLPEEIGKLENLMDLDVSCNEISCLPTQIGDLASLRCLNLRRNFLVELPLEISRLQLFKLDFSSNRIEQIPTVFRKMETLEQIILDHNPLSSPPAYICTKGRQHIMKYLHIQAVKEDRKRGILNNDPDMKRNVRKSLPPQQSSEEFRNLVAGPEAKWKRHTVMSNDSGYSTSDGVDRNGWQSGEVYEENTQGNPDSRLLSPSSSVHYQSSQHYRSNSTLGGPPRFGISTSTSRTLYEFDRSDLSGYSSHSRYNSEMYSHNRIPPRSQSYGTTLNHNTNSSFFRYPPSPSLSRSRTVSPSLSFAEKNQNPHLNRSLSPTHYESMLLRQKSSDILTRQHSNSSLASSSGLRDEEPHYRSDEPRYQSNESRYRSHSITADKPISDMISPRGVGYHRNGVAGSNSSLYSNDSKEIPGTSPTTPTPFMTGDLEDEFTRELKRQKADYERKKKQAEQIRAKQLEEEEEREKEERRRAVLKVQEEQEHRRQEELRRQEEARRQEERLKQEEDSRRQEEVLAQSRQEAIRIQAADENKLEEPPKPAEPKQAAERNKLANNYYNHSASQANNYSRSHLQSPPSQPSSLPSHPQPPNSLPLHGIIAGPTSPSSLTPSSYPSLQQRNDSNYIQSELEYRTALSSQSFKEQRKQLSSTTQYRRAASDTLKKPGPQTDTLNFINRNGETSSTSTTPSVSPSPSPRNSISHLAKPSSPSGSTSHLAKLNSPMGSTSQLAKPVGTSKSSVPRANGPANAGSNQAVRRTKMAGESSNTSSPATARSTKTSGIANVKTSSLNPATVNLRRSSNSSTTDDDCKLKKALTTSGEPPRIKSKLEEPKQRGTLQAPMLKKSPQIDNIDTNKRIQNQRPPTNNYGSGRGRLGTKPGEDGGGLRRREEAHREEAEQLDRLRQIIESRLRVTLPDNLAEALRDGVVLCHLANQIRPRSVGSIHVPSPAVPKLTVAKCRRNVDNFLDACRKIGVDQEQVCGAHDILDEKGISRVAITVGALVAIGSNPKQSVV